MRRKSDSLRGEKAFCGDMDVLSRNRTNYVQIGFDN